METFEINHDTKRFRFKLEDGHRLGLPVGNHISARATINGNMVCTTIFCTKLDPNNFFSNDELHIILTRRNLEICKHTIFLIINEIVF